MQKTFCNLHAVGNYRVKTLAEKFSSGMILSDDEQGKHHNCPKKVPEDIKKQVKEHIKSFPQRKSHYS